MSRLTFDQITNIASCAQARAAAEITYFPAGTGAIYRRTQRYSREYSSWIWAMAHRARLMGPRAAQTIG